MHHIRRPPSNGLHSWCRRRRWRSSSVMGSNHTQAPGDPKKEHRRGRGRFNSRDPRQLRTGMGTNATEEYLLNEGGLAMRRKTGAAIGLAMGLSTLIWSGLGGNRMSQALAQSTDASRTIKAGPGT